MGKLGRYSFPLDVTPLFKFKIQVTQIRKVDTYIID